MLGCCASTGGSPPGLAATGGCGWDGAGARLGVLEQAASNAAQPPRQTIFKLAFKRTSPEYG
ncbi:hypothetical protein YWS52_05840 [Chitiniphilus shinanonensis]